MSRFGSDPKKTIYIVLLEAPYRGDIPRPSDKHTVLLTIDLTRAVAAEAIARKAVAVVSYRGFFPSLPFPSLPKDLLRYKVP